MKVRRTLFTLVLTFGLCGSGYLPWEQINQGTGEPKPWQTLATQAYLKDVLYKRLPLPYHSQVNTLVEQILLSAKQLNLDPLYLLSMMEVESSFNPDARGGAGELGLFQIKPTTARWIAKKKGLPWYGRDSLHDPKTAMTLATAYLSYLKKRLPKTYFSAYNMGATKVRRLLHRGVQPKVYWGRIKCAFHRHDKARNLNQPQTRQKQPTLAIL